MKKLIIIPTYNEEGNILSVLDELREYNTDFDILVVNDGSNDNTKILLEKWNGLKVDLPVNIGIGGAVQTGYLFAERNNYDIAVQIDGDGQHNPAFLNTIIEPIEEGKCDIVIGSRFVCKEKQGFQSSAFRRIGIMIIGFLIYVITGERIFDVTSGFRAVGKAVIHDYSRYYPDDFPEAEAIVLSLKKGRKLMELPVEMRERKYGSSSITKGKSVYYMIKVSLAIIITALSDI